MCIDIRRFPFIAKTDFTILLVAAAGSSFLDLKLSGFRLGMGRDFGLVLDRILNNFWSMFWTSNGKFLDIILDRFVGFFNSYICLNLCTYTHIYLHMNTYTRKYLCTPTYTYLCLHIAAYAYMLSSGGRSPEARWRSQTEVVLRDRLI